MAAASFSSPPERRMLGVGLRIVSATAFACMSGLLKLASGHGVNTAEMIFYRNAGAMPIVAAWVAFGPGWRAIRTRRPIAHVTRSGLGLVAMLLSFGTLSLLPLGEATALTYAAPILSTLLSALFLREVVGVHRWTAVATGFAGVLLVVHPTGESLPILGVITGICAAFGQAAVMITVRQISRSETIASIVFWFTTMTMLAGALMLPVFGHTHDGITYAMLFGAGLCGGCAQITMTGSLRHAPVAVVMPFDYLQIVWGIAFGWLITTLPPTPTTLGGAALIAASGIYTAWRESKRGYEPAQAQVVPEA
ncbi:DMT family transporter [Sphingomonas sp. MMS24-J13]|uniref:DMT family transporter n=1 Tax=Sphingomonas sp. MMS24-J13 TaxID=3238686 RepID=UPI00384CC82F